MSDTVPVIEITGYDHQGRGVGRLDGKVCFAYDCLVGEQIEIEKIIEYKKYNYIERFRVVKAHPDRVMPRCGVFGRCGGCSLQHTSSKMQKAIKQGAIEEQLDHAGFKNIKVGFVEGPEYGYRRKARLSIRYNKKHNSVWMGFRHIHLPRIIVDIDACPVLVPALSQGLPAVKKAITALEIADKIPQIELMELQGQCSVTIRHLAPLDEAGKKILEALADELQWSVFVQPKGLSSTVLLRGPDGQSDTFTIRYKQYSMAIGVHDFVQVNEAINNKLIEQALHALELSRDDTVLDLFCGLGNFSYPIALHAGKVIAADVCATMIERATAQAKLNKLDNITFSQADLFENIGVLEGKKGVKCLLDPPRSGAKEVVSHLQPSLAPRVVYVSCNPQTFIRDAQILRDKGYELESVKVFAMFPQTTHAELLAVFS